MHLRRREGKAPETVAPWDMQVPLCAWQRLCVLGLALALLYALVSSEKLGNHTSLNHLREKCSENIMSYVALFLVTLEDQRGELTCPESHSNWNSTKIQGDKPSPGTACCSGLLPS